MDFMQDRIWGVFLFGMSLLFAITEIISGLYLLPLTVVSAALGIAYKVHLDSQIIVRDIKRKGNKK